MPRIDKIPDEVVADIELAGTLWRFYESGGWSRPAITELRPCKTLHDLGLLDRAVMEPCIVHGKVRGCPLYRVAERAIPALAEASISADDDNEAEARGS